MNKSKKLKKIQKRNQDKSKKVKKSKICKNNRKTRKLPRKNLGGANKKERQEELKHKYSQLLKQILNKHNKKNNSKYDPTDITEAILNNIDIPNSELKVDYKESWIKGKGKREEKREADKLLDIILQKKYARWIEEQKEADKLRAVIHQKENEIRVIKMSSPRITKSVTKKMTDIRKTQKPIIDELMRLLDSHKKIGNLD
jgi:hypothetical protein